jgi:LytR cell envelope-related transcriptional attenuator
VEFSAPVPPQVRPWRTATIVASGVAAIELVLLLIVGIALLSKPLSAHAKQAALEREVVGSIPSQPEPKRTTLSRRETSVLVLNGNGIAGAAASEASRARARGYMVAGTANAPRSYGKTVVMYRAGHRPEAKRLAADMGVTLVGPLDGLKTRQLHGAEVVVILGT